MRPDALRGRPALPDSEVEWEDLLVRLEVVPRVVRHTIEDHEGPGAAGVLREMIRREEAVGRWLEALAAGEPVALAERGDATGEELAWLVQRFAALRARTFVMVQRRGIEVWRWEGPLSDGAPASVYQVLSALAERDGEALARIRAVSPC
jgi:hypothetical protein